MFCLSNYIRFFLFIPLVYVLWWAICEGVERCARRVDVAQLDLDRAVSIG